MKDNLGKETSSITASTIPGNKNIDEILQLTQSITAMKVAGIDIPQSMMNSLNAMMQQAAEKEKAAEKEQAAVPDLERPEINKEKKRDYIKLKKKDLSCVTGKEDFLNSELYQTLYGSLYNNYPGCPSVARADISAVEYMLGEKAKEYGRTELQKFFKKRCTEEKNRMKAEFEQAKRGNERMLLEIEEAEKQRMAELGKMTEYNNLPENCENMYIGEEWTADDDGVRKLEQHGKTIKMVEACMYPIMVTKLYRPLDNAGEATRKVELRFRSEEGWQKATVEREKISNANKAVALSNMGAGITSENARQFTNFMSSMMKESSKHGALKIVNTLNQLGWDKEFKNFLPFTTEEFVFERQNEMPELMEALTPHGTRDAWYAKFKAIRAFNYAPFKLGTATLLASVILPMLPKQDSFLLNIYGGSGYGKSAMTAILTTIFSSMDDGGILLDSDNTPTYLELAANTLNNFPMVLEDISKGDEKKKKEFQQITMMLANGRGRNRATKDLRQRKKNKFKMTTLANSEQNVTNGWTTNGSVYRVLPMLVTERFPYLDKDKYPSLENIEDIIAFFQNNYGYCGREFVEKVKELGQKEIIKRNGKNLERVRKLARDNGREGRQATSIAVMLTADQIATEFLFQDGIELTDEELLNVMVKPDDADQYMRFYHTVIERCVSNPSKIEGFTDPEDIRGEYWGIYKRKKAKNSNGDLETIETLSIFPERLQVWAKELDLDLNLFYREMRCRGLLYADKGTNQTKAKSIRNDRIERVIKLKIPHYEKESEDETSENGASGGQEQQKERPRPRSGAVFKAQVQQVIDQAIEMEDDDDIPFD